MSGFFNWPRLISPLGADPTTAAKILVEILLKVVENLRSWFQVVFFPQDVSRCLEFVMQISSKFNSRSISREYTFQAIQLKSTDLILDLVPELITVYCSKYDCISKYLLCRNSQISNLAPVLNKCVKMCDKRCDKRLTFWLCNVCPWHQGDEPSGLWKWGWSDQMRSKVNNSLTLWITDFVIVHPEGMNHPLSGYDNLHAWSNWL